jgi:prolyl oligopeptidase PreP (S9A serine peptidase family)
MHDIDPPSAEHDPHLWLEETDGKNVRDWVAKHNARTREQLQDEQFELISPDVAEYSQRTRPDSGNSSARRICLQFLAGRAQSQGYGDARRLRSTGQKSLNGR